MEGEVSLFFDSQKYYLQKNNIIFMPIASSYEIVAQTDVEFVINYFNKHIDLCEKVALESLTPYLNTLEKAFNPVLIIKPPMEQFLTSLVFYLGKGVFCKHFHEIKQKELFFLLRFFYTKEEVAGLFAPIISCDLDFKNRVLTNSIKVNSVKELANICNYSLSTFNRAFKDNFNECPYDWLQNQKLKYIIVKLSDKNIPLSDIVDEFKFSSPAHFTTYCKKYLKKTPSQFRKELANKTEEYY
jgi:AraC-like DNA-binding protein